MLGETLARARWRGHLLCSTLELISLYFGLLDIPIYGIIVEKQKDGQTKARLMSKMSWLSTRTIFRATLRGGCECSFVLGSQLLFINALLHLLSMGTTMSICVTLGKRALRFFLFWLSAKPFDRWRALARCRRMSHVSQ